MGRGTSPRERTQGERKRLLAVFAHPDDETFLAGPLLAKLAAAGWDVQLICATAAEGREPSWTELHGAAATLGISGVHGLGYTGSWMRKGASAREDSLITVPVKQVAERIRSIAAQVRPDIMLTDSAYGAYGHPDHILVHRAAKQAAESMAQDGEEAPALYAMAYSMPLVRLWVRLLPLLGVDTRRLAGRDDLDLRAAVAAPQRISASINVRRFVGPRKRASASYRRLIEAAPLPLKLLEALPVAPQRIPLGQVRLSRVWPPQTADHPETVPPADAFP